MASCAKLHIHAQGGFWHALQSQEPQLFKHCNSCAFRKLQSQQQLKGRFFPKLYLESMQLVEQSAAAIAPRKQAQLPLGTGLIADRGFSAGQHDN